MFCYCFGVVALFVLVWFCFLCTCTNSLFSCSISVAVDCPVMRFCLWGCCWLFIPFCTPVPPPGSVSWTREQGLSPPVPWVTEFLSSVCCSVVVYILIVVFVYLYLECKATILLRKNKKYQVLYWQKPNRTCKYIYIFLRKSIQNLCDVTI